MYLHSQKLKNNFDGFEMNGLLKQKYPSLRIENINKKYTPSNPATAMSQCQLRPRAVIALRTRLVPRISTQRRRMVWMQSHFECTACRARILLSFDIC